MEGEKVESKPQQVEQGQKQVDQKKNHKKGEKRQKKEFKSEYVFDADAVTVDTQLPALPKKTQLIKKPEIEECKEKQKKNRDKIAKFIEQKKQIRNQNFKPNRNTKKGQDGKHTQFNKQIEEVKQLRERLAEVKKQRNEKRDKLHTLIQEVKKVNTTLKELGGATKGSRENVQEKLEQLEHRLTTATLTKQEQKSLNTQIMLTKRKIKDAESVGNIQYKLQKAEDRKQELDVQIDQVKADKQPLQKEFKQIIANLQNRNTLIDGYKVELDANKNQRAQQKQKNNKEWEQWKQNKKKRLDEIEQKIKKLHEQNDNIWNEFNVRKEEYWKQKHFIDWVEWQMKVKTRKVNEKQRQRKRLMYEEKDKQRQKEEQLQKYIGQIELCNILIEYLKNMQGEHNQTNAAVEQQNNKQSVDVNAKLAGDSQWKKQKGLQVIKSKKSKQDEEAPKKNKKQKKRNVQKEEAKPFNIPYNIQNQFQALKILAPTSFEQIDKKVQQLRDREKLFERGCQPEQEVAEQDAKLLDEIKNKKPSQKKVNDKAQTKTQGEQFPTI